MRGKSKTGLPYFPPILKFQNFSIRNRVRSGSASAEVFDQASDGYTMKQLGAETKACYLQQYT